MPVANVHNLNRPDILTWTITEMVITEMVM